MNMQDVQNKYISGGFLIRNLHKSITSQLISMYHVWKFRSHITLSCNVALRVEVWDIPLLFDEWRIYLAVRLCTLLDRHKPVLCCQLFHSHRCCLASAAALFLSLGRRGGVSAHDTHLERAVWMGRVKRPVAKTNPTSSELWSWKETHRNFQWI